MMNRTTKFIPAITVLLISLILASCATAPAAVSSTPSGNAGVYSGHGEDPSLLVAMNAAKIDAVKKAIVAILGESTANARAAELEELIYSTNNPNLYVYPETMETLKKENIGTTENFIMVYEIRIKVNMDYLQQVLDRAGIEAGSAARTAAGGSASAAEAAGSAEAVGTSETQPEDPVAEAATADAAPSADQQAFVRRYINSLSYMVFYSEESSLDSFLMRGAVVQANSWLANEGYSIVDPDQIEEIREDSELVYQEQTGGDIGILQWIAQRMNADVYIEIEADGTSRTENGSFLAQTMITVKMYETSSGRLLGSLPYTSPETFSRSSAESALANALQSSVYQAMPRVLQQSRQQMSNEMARGIRYELVFLNTADSRLMSSFRKALGDEVSDLNTLSQSPEETRYEVYYFGQKEDLEDIIYDLSDRIAGFEYLTLVLTRGKMLTFDTGLAP